MKAILLVAVFLCAPAVDKTISPREREKAVAELHASLVAFQDATHGLSDAQWKFKPAPDRWSVAECAEHIGVTETITLKMIREQALKMPPEPEKRSQVKFQDDELISIALDRSQKFKAPEIVQPSHRWSQPAEIESNVVAAREQTLQFVEATQDDLRDHCGATPSRFWK